MAKRHMIKTRKTKPLTLAMSLLMSLVMAFTMCGINLFTADHIYAGSVQTASGSVGMAPASDETAPASAGAASGSGETAPASDETVSGSGETAPASDETASGAGETAPASDETASGAGETASGAGETAPGAGETDSDETGSDETALASNEAGPDGKTTYRALLIGNTYPGTESELNGPENDINFIERTLSKNADLVNKYSYINKINNATAAQITDAISLFAASDDSTDNTDSGALSAQADSASDDALKVDGDDITLFFFSGHGLVDEHGGECNGALCAYDKENDLSPYTLDTLATNLANIPGKVIVLLDCCGSGAAVKTSSAEINSNSLSKDIESFGETTSESADSTEGGEATKEAKQANGMELVTPEEPETVETFNNTVIDTFMNADVLVAADVPDDVANTKSGAISKSGELAQTKFHVLTACDAGNLSNSIPLTDEGSGYCGLFTLGVCWAGGYDPSYFYNTYLPFFDADFAPLDRVVTWTEFAKYATNTLTGFSDAIGPWFSDGDVYQMAQAYPATDDSLVVYKADKFDIYNVPEFELGYSATTYSGKSKTPTVTLHRGMIIDLPNFKNGTDYSLTYKNNKNVGTASVYVKGKGNYYNYFYTTFKINPKGTSLKSLSKGKKSFTAKWNKQSAKMSSSRITGYQLRYSTSSSMKSAKTTTVKGYATTSKTIKRLKAKKKYYVQVRTYKSVSGKKYYSSWSKKKSITTR